MSDETRDPEPEELEVLQRRSWQAKGGRAVHLHDVRGMLAEKDAEIERLQETLDLVKAHRDRLFEGTDTKQLRARVAELQAEVERLRVIDGVNKQDNRHMVREWDQAQDEIVSLRAKVAELEARDVTAMDLRRSDRMDGYENMASRLNALRSPATEEAP